MAILWTIETAAPFHGTCSCDNLGLYHAHRSDADACCPGGQLMRAHVCHGRQELRAITSQTRPKEAGGMRREYCDSNLSTKLPLYELDAI